MSAIKLSTPSSGSISLSPADTASNLTITVPAVSGTMATIGPAFSASDTATTATTGTITKIVFDTEIFDTNSAFDGTTFTPQVAGYYQVNCYTITGVNTLSSSCSVYIYKNGTAYQTNTTVCVAGFSGGSQLSTVVYMNGSTDYLEVYGRNAANANLGVSTFSACLVRAE
jgi:hypothetical protein